MELRFSAVRTEKGFLKYQLLSSLSTVNYTISLLALFKTYCDLNAGPPSEPVGLSSELSPVAGVLVLSWSPPWTPDGVQLHYTVTVWTNTSTITMFNTSSTTITISRDNITTSDSTSECDQYVWSVTAINPAGTSTPTNITAPISFKPGNSQINAKTLSFLNFF